jgi:hypothetical protein
MKRPLSFAIASLMSLFLLPLGLLGADSISLDYLAADAEAALYRTGLIDPVIEKIPDTLAKNVFVEPKTFLKQLTAFLVQGAGNDYLVVKRIHDWIVDSIAYDFTADTDVYGLLKTKRTNCTGYSYLFQEMAGFAGIKADVVFGFSRTYLYPDGRQGDHAWNVVLINGKRYLVDTTHDARRRYRNGVFAVKKPYTDDELFENPQYKILLNFPYDSRYQLLDPPLTYEQYMSAPRFRLAFVKHGLKASSPLFDTPVFQTRAPLGNINLTGVSDTIETASLAHSLVLESPVNVQLRLIISDADKTYDAHAYSYKKGNQAILLFSAPGKGTYKAQIDARFIGREDWENVYSFTLVESKAAGPAVAQ